MGVEEDQITQRVIDMYLDGSEVNEIIETTGRSRTAIYYQLNKHNVTLRRGQADGTYTQEQWDGLEMECQRLREQNVVLLQQIVTLQGQMLENK